MRDDERDLLATVVQQSTAYERPSSTEGTFVLAITEGPQRGESFRLDATRPTRTLIGTSPACEIRLTDKAVSRRHVALERVGSACKVVDLSSTNGTWVDRVKIVE